VKPTNDSKGLKNSLFIGQVQFTFLLGLIFLASYLLFNQGEEQTTLTFMRWYMGIFLLVFATVKLLDYKMFILTFSTYDILAKRVRVYAYMYPFILLGLAGMYLVDVLPYFRNITTLVVALVASIGVFKDVFILRNKSLCSMPGRVIRLPYNTMGLIESVGLVVLSSICLLLLNS